MTSRPRADTAADGLEVVEFTDPLCPWAWGAEPLFRRLRAELAQDRSGLPVVWRRAYAILFDADDDPAPDPDAETAWYAGYVAEVSGHTGSPRAERLGWVAETSWPASLAARAAEAQGPEVAERVLRRLRETVFVLGEPADTPERVAACLRGVPGLDAARLAREAASAEVLASVRADRAEARDPLPQVLALRAPGPHPGAAKELPDGGHRYALPTLVLRGPGGCRVAPGRREPQEYADAVRAACPGLLADAFRPLSAAAALERHRSLTAPELTALTGSDEPPAGALRLDTAGGPLWLHPDEAEGHPVLAGRPPAGR